VVIVDRRPAPGGHWLDAYPFVRLHQPSAYYGVNSTPLGEDRLEAEGSDSGCYERAGGKEICGYFDDVMRHRLMGSGRVRFFPMCEYTGDGRFRSCITGRDFEVDVRRSVVDASNAGARIPATDPPPFEVAGDANCIPVGDITRLAAAPAGYVIVGGGKTACDACCWLLEHGTPPEEITWIRPRDTWLLNRSYAQPGRLVVDTFEGTVLQLEALAAAESVADAFVRAEDPGVLLRIDRSVEPTMMKGATISVGEVEQLREIENVVRLGHVERIGRDRIMLEEGSIPTSPDHVHVHCASSGLDQGPRKPVFADGLINVQPLARTAVLGGSLIGYIESTGRSVEEKQRLCRPNGPLDTPLDWLRWQIVGLKAGAQWGRAADVREWLENSRMNPIKGLASPEHKDAIGELQGRFLAALGPAMAKFEQFSADAP